MGIGFPELFSKDQIVKDLLLSECMVQSFGGQKYPNFSQKGRGEFENAKICPHSLWMNPKNSFVFSIVAKKNRLKTNYRILKILKGLGLSS